MAKFTSVSTKTGDKGTTSLANGERVSKTDPVFEVIGTLDELNSWLGLVVAKLETSFPETKKYLLKIQDTLFYVGAELAKSPKAKLKEKDLQELEKISEELQKQMSDGWHTQFLLPGGTEIGAYLDIARTVARRVERLTLSYSQDHQVSQTVLKYLNRLSDYLYVVRCDVNQRLEYKEQEFKNIKE